MEAPTNTEKARQELLKLDTQKKAIETEILSLTEALTLPGMPGVSGPLVDSEGFPLADVDICEVRKMRQKLTCLKNDHTQIMKTLDRGLKEIHAEYKKEGGAGN
eukprot:TRINITY_DN743_c0_g3_i4.p1 TRINITY_DN743_c0_g3~~TRINITY_DN743_c0_g3_i4.p1  ORF type:complete len:120 (+),score=30.95 TRINITY_DN743_c0_g3_i4:49-360(+)